MKDYLKTLFVFVLLKTFNGATPKAEKSTLGV